MPHFSHILYVSHAFSNESSALKQALSQVRNHQAHFDMVVLLPPLPDSLAHFSENLAPALVDHAENIVKNTLSQLDMASNTLSYSISIIQEKRPALAIINTVAQKQCDLVVKEVEPTEQYGFKALDMDLLRKCPTPVWLCRPITKHREKINIAVAIDPADKDDEALSLSQALLAHADMLAGECTKNFHIIACWDFPFEQAMLDNVYVRYPAEEIQQQIDELRSDNAYALQSLVNQASIKNTFTTHHLRGFAIEEIPTFVKKHDIDIVIMGTVARTGIAGFMIGNTAENIIQRLGCSLLTLKP